MQAQRTTLFAGLATSALVLAFSASAATVADLSATASALAGRQVAVHCHRLEAGAAGHVAWGYVNGKRVPGDVAVIAPQECAALKALPGRVTAYAPFAVLVLAHESAHLRGIRSEEKAECFAYRNVYRMARLLGLERTRARALRDAAAPLTYCLSR